MADIRLLSTDFDGTLIDHDRHPPFCPQLDSCLRKLREAGVLWAINTGRTLPQLEDGLEELGVELAPDYVLTNEREVFRPMEGGKGWSDFGEWNVQCLEAHNSLFENAIPALQEITAFAKTKTNAFLAGDFRTTAGIIATDEEEMDRILAFLDGVCRRFPELGCQRNGVYLRFCHVNYHKGSALEELMRLLDLRPDQVFAVGDHHNDLSMLDGKYAHHVACPRNSIAIVKQTVRQAGGYVARASCGTGVAEALQHFFPEILGSPRN